MAGIQDAVAVYGSSGFAAPLPLLPPLSPSPPGSLLLLDGDAVANWTKEHAHHAAVSEIGQRSFDTASASC